MHMPSFSLTHAATLFCALAVVACGPPDEATRARSGPIVGAFLVSDFFTPSGLMGDGQFPGRVTVNINKNCRTPRPPGAQGDCYRFDHRIGSERWSGAFWVFPSNSWGSVPGREVYGPRDLGPDNKGVPLRGYTQLRFWASATIEPLASGVPVKPPQLVYQVGGIDGSKAIPTRPYSDTGCQVFPANPSDPTSMRGVYCDQEFKVQNSSEVTGDWKQYVLPLDQWGITSVIGAFEWSINDNDNPGQNITLYFDDIVWE